MAKISIILDTRRPNALGRYPIKFRIVNRNTNTTIGTSISVSEKHFTGDIEHAVSPAYANAKNINTAIRTLYYKYQNAIVELDNSGKLPAMSATDIRNYVDGEKEVQSDVTFSNAIDTYIDKCRKPKTAQGYAYARDLLYRYMEKKCIFFEEINYACLNDFNHWLEKEGLSVNSRSLVMRNIRAVFNDAMKSDIIDPSIYPFRKFVIERAKKEKEFLTDEQLTTLLTSQVKQSSYAKARDLFMLSFYLCGINPIDMYQLPNEKKRISFIREKIAHKEPDRVRIVIQPEAKAIIDKYAGADHLLRFADTGTSYAVFKRNSTRDLCLLGKQIDIHLYFYLARYTWATIASRIGIAHEVIDKALGHVDMTESEKDYIAFDWNRVDKANRQVIDYVNGLSQNSPSQSA